MLLFFFLFSLISLIADGPYHYHPACGHKGSCHKGSSHLSPVHALQFFYRDASSALLQLVNQWLNFTYSRSHAFRYERKNTNPTLVRIELTTSVLPLGNPIECHEEVLSLQPIIPHLNLLTFPPTPWLGDAQKRSRCLQFSLKRF